MSDEPTKLILGDTAVSAVERRPPKFFGRRAKSQAVLTHCENCGAALAGRYCSQCGQAAIDYRRSFRHVILDVLDSFLNWDSKVFATLGLLIVRPWQLTNEFVAGKRQRYLHPLRLYLLASIVFFFAVNYSARSLHIDDKPLKPKERAEIEAALKKEDLPPFARAALEKRLAQSSPAPQTPASPQQAASPSPQPGGSRTERVSPVPEPSVSSTPVIEARPSKKPNGAKDYGIVKFDYNEPKNGFEKWLDQQAKEKIGENGINAGVFIRSMISNLPYMMLCSIPLFALILKLLYIRRGVLYIDHLIYALHIHTFAYVATMSIILITIGLNRVYPGVLAGWIIALLWCAFAIQIFLSIRRVYRQGWFKTLIKFCLGGFVYLIVLLAGFAATFLMTLALP